MAVDRAASFLLSHRNAAEIHYVATIK